MSRKRIWKQRGNTEGDLLSRLLLNRGILSKKDEEAFFDPRYERDCHDPFLLTDLKQGVERIVQAVNAREKITIYADYDADAVTAAVVLLRFFDRIGYRDVDYYIPDRFSEGYGVNVEAVKTLAGRGTKLLVTVDCGINARKAIEVATQLGIDTIITDHHQLTGALPRAVAVINPYRPDDIYPFKALTGVGVAFKLTQALALKFKNQNAKLKIKEGFEKWLLDLVAIGTIADCQTLLGENRVLVKWGLYVMEKTRWAGLRALLETVGFAAKSLDTYAVAFGIAPRINAAGRIEHANLAVELLLEDDSQKARMFAVKLNELNRQRQDLTQQILSEARDQVLVDPTRKILLAAGEGWPKGVVGLVAGKLTEEFSRPVIILEKGSTEATGSARSVASFNIVEALEQGKDMLTKYGGHPMAAGFTIRIEHIEIFYQKILSYAEAVLSEADLSNEVVYEAEVFLHEITADLVEALEKFAPFGLGNPRPRFRINGLTPLFPSAIGRDEKHLRVYFEASQKIGGIGFNMGYWAERLQPEKRIDIICEPQLNEWNGKRRVQLKIIDINYSQ